MRCASRPSLLRGPGCASRSTRVNVRANAAAPPSTERRFVVRVSVPFGCSVKACGEAKELGGWNANDALALTWSEHDEWSASVAVGDGAFKFVISYPDGGVEWEGGENRSVGTSEPAGFFGKSLPPAPEKPPPPPPPPVEAAPSAAAESTADNANGHVPETPHSWNGTGAAAAPPPTPTHETPAPAAAAAAPPPRPPPPPPPAAAKPPPPPAAPAAPAPAAAATAPAAPAAVPPPAPPPPPPRAPSKPVAVSSSASAVAASLAKRDSSSASWLQKLEAAAAEAASGGATQLAAAAVYLQWVSTGVIACAEAGGHARPSKNATVGKALFLSLEKAVSDAPGDEATLLAARAAFPWLPSFSGEFMTAVPLTRIRDIAHRNDIPQDMKREIKTTIQNKLHRCAGPEDLVATEAMLKRILDDEKSFSAPFVAEFKTFTLELRDFFNASSAFDRLKDLKGSMDGEAAKALDGLTAAKGAVDTAGAGATPQQLLAALAAATAVRASLCAKLASEPASDGDAIVVRQNTRAAETGLEGYAFVLSSRLAASAEAAVASPPASLPWGDVVASASLAAAQLRLAGFQPSEAAAVESGLAAAGSGGAAAALASADREALLRLRAAAQRASRLAAAHADATAGAFGEAASALGATLKDIPKEVSAVFGEAAVRASPAFPLASLAVALCRCADKALGDAGGAEAVVGGTAVGTLVKAERLVPGAHDAPSLSKLRSILLLSKADGEEELGGSGVAGILLAQQLPHLSHLAVRARQEKVVLVTTSDEGAPLAAAASKLVGKAVVLAAKPDGAVTIRAATDAEVATATSSSAAAAAPGAASAKGAKPPAPAARAEDPAPLPLAGVPSSAAGAKAAACGTLLSLAESSGGAFSAPGGAVLPFGSMEAAVASAGLADAYAKLLASLETAQPGEALDTAVADMAALCSKAAPSAQRLEQLRALLPPGASSLAVRSSANVEDLAGMSAAGLYESVVGVPAKNGSDASSDALASAVSSVWASLHSRRAVLARRAAGVPQADASMGVLVQAAADVETAFVLHTAAPGGPKTHVLAELCAGLGDTLASGAQGSGWRLMVGPESEAKVKTLSFANFSTADTPGGRVAVDYAAQPLSCDAGAREAAGKALGAVGWALQKAFDGVAQDVEGGLLRGGGVVIVQTRPQPEDA